jgi:DNA-binding IclR family transcriptional regulator
MANPHQAFGLTEMTRRLNLNKATCHAILTTMATYGFLVQHPKTKAYRLGPSIIAAGNAAFAQFPVLEYSRPALESLEGDLDLGFAVTGRSKSHLVLLALYGKASALIDNFQLGLRLPNIAPIGACFTAWSPPKHLQAWLTAAHEARGEYNERLDQRLRVSVIGIRARGYEVVLRTEAETKLHEDLKHIQENWNLDDLEEVTRNYHLALSEEQVHLDRIEPRVRYDVSTINVPVFAQRQLPALCFAAGSFSKSVTGAEIETIAERMRAAANEVADVAKRHAPYEEEPRR